MSSTSQNVKNSYNKYVVNNRRNSNMSCPAEYQPFRSSVQLMVSGMSGMIFGMAIEKGRVFEPNIIRGQMLFTNFTMLKMFLSACAAGMMGISVLSMIPATVRVYENLVDKYVTAHMTKSMTGAAIGGFILGCGMTLAGACPGMVLAQVGAAVPDAMFTVFGGLCGAYVFALTQPIVALVNKTRLPYRYYTLDEILGSPYLIIALPITVFLGMVVFTLEVFRPWESEVEQAGSGLFGLRAWPPFVSGVLIGMLQIPTVLSVNSGLGSSTGYMTVASQALVIKPLQTLFPHLLSYRSGASNWWQVFYMGGAVLGAHLSARASGTLGSVSGVGPINSFVGGILMVYGARMAGGCTSGHGLTGMALLMLLSFIAIPSMFAGGISLAALMNYIEGIEM